MCVCGAEMENIRAGQKNLIYRNVYRDKKLNNQVFGAESRAPWYSKCTQLLERWHKHELKLLGAVCIVQEWLSSPVKHLIAPFFANGWESFRLLGCQKLAIKWHSNWNYVISANLEKHDFLHQIKKGSLFGQSIWSRSTIIFLATRQIYTKKWLQLICLPYTPLVYQSQNWFKTDVLQLFIGSHKRIIFFEIL